MRTKNRLNAIESKYYSPEITSCPECGNKLKYCHPVWRKTISTLEGEFKIINLGYRCVNDSCSNNTVYRSAEAEQLSMKHITYGMDVIARIGHLRFKEHKTRSEIATILTEMQVKISERQVQKLYERYALLLRSNVEENLKDTLEEVVKQSGGLILSIDGVQPEKGNETLYVIREVLSGTILAAQNLKSSASQELMGIIQPIIDWGYPIQGFVSDGQQSIRLAIEKIAPDIPYQYCQFHYFKDIAKPLVEKDRKLKTNIKKKLRGIREIERKIEDSSSETFEEEIASDYIAAIRSVLLEDGKPPFELPGTRVFERTKAIKDSIEKCLDKKGDSSP
ncbi:transposase [Scopulibacillus darangshiensis]|uniref:transposase n=1 Tax=Scopulibacillus darangshiensis TaxID=442528 RepID=UPI001048D3B4|nr:transposase [Scopulibacillus darangshiensis]